MNGSGLQGAGGVCYVRYNCPLLVRLLLHDACLMHDVEMSNVFHPCLLRCITLSGHELLISTKSAYIDIQTIKLKNFKLTTAYDVSIWNC